MTVSDSLSIKSQVFELLEKDHTLQPRQIQKRLKLSSKSYHYLRNLSSLWKVSHFFGVGSKCPTSQHNVRAFCYVPASVDRKSAIVAGWVPSKNRNKVLIWKDVVFGRIEWWQTRRVLVHINRPQTMGRVKQFLSNAFFKTGLIWDERVFNPWIDSVQWFGSHDVYEIGERLPYMRLDGYREELGFVLRAGDRSNPTCYEIEWAKPDWMEKHELLSHMAIVCVGQNSQVILQFNEFMKGLSSQPIKAAVKDPSVI